MKRKKLLCIFVILIIPILACSSGNSQITPTPTKTPKPLKPIQVVLPTFTVTPLALPVTEPTAAPTHMANTPLPESLPTNVPLASDTPIPAPLPPTDTPSPPPTDTPLPKPPTKTPLPPPPPTATPIPLPPTATPLPLPSPTPASQGPEVTIELPDGDTYKVGDQVTIIITARDPDGVNNFKWGVFNQGNQSLVGGDKNCNRATECSTKEKFKAALKGQFEIGVEAKDGNGTATIQRKQLYIGG